MKNFISTYKIEILFGVIAFILLINNWSIILWNQDEAAYAGFGMNMIQNRDYLVPEFIWSDAHRKTPFHFWMITLNFLIFGCNEFGTRFSSSIFIFATLILLYRQVRYFLDETTAFWSTVLLASNLFIPALAKVAVTDATLLFF
ncbi:MAG: glycosyltransferase family 39 protein, partial [Bacteroidota bacterium]